MYIKNVERGYLKRAASYTPPYLCRRVLVDETNAVDCILPKGGVSVHHPNLIHGSNANHSPHRRCGLTIRYIPTSTRILLRGQLTLEGRWPGAFLLRGKAVDGINDYNPRPHYIAGKHMAFRGCENWK